MRSMLIVCSLLATVAFAEGPLTDATSAAVSKRFAAAIKCDPKAKDLQRAWCAVTQLDKAAFVAPKQPTTFLGISMELPDDAEVVSQLLGTTTVSALHVSPTGVKLTSLKASNAEEQKEMAPVLVAIALALKQGGEAIPVSAGLSGFLDSERAKPGYPIKAEGKSMAYTGKIPARLYQVGKTYVVLESAPKGHYVSVFPMAPLKKL